MHVLFVTQAEAYIVYIDVYFRETKFDSQLNLKLIFLQQLLVSNGCHCVLKFILVD